MENEERKRLVIRRKLVSPQRIPLQESVEELKTEKIQSKRNYQSLINIGLFNARHQAFEPVNRIMVFRAPIRIRLSEGIKRVPVQTSTGMELLTLDMDGTYHGAVFYQDGGVRLLFEPAPREDDL